MIKEPTLRELAKARSLSGAVAIGQRGGYTISVNYSAPNTQRLLANARGETRLFSNLNTLAIYLRKLGIPRFEVDATGYEAARVRAPRPDRVEAMKRARSKPRQESLELNGKAQ